ncbi:DUF418 domain-containing protein [Marinigracilibium pacificum]|uniref:DUF418 domain-containing protein n=1 Tax=Marinigracilibium pacificum TaxID=2729599 RepID=A0A848J1C8_9BACT|nr:DUF418 domain-containing protein [Marinigracilibium pacificum]NMM48284.1 DUF418 domain-containing protein [Marinigracilibium pacificum]
MSQNIRLPHLDAIRGLALWGIFIVNIVWFSFPSEYFGELYGGGPHWYNDFINFLRTELFGGRTATIFALLFGLGMGMQWNKWKSSSILLKRNIVLALFGILHIILLLGGDILLDYALFGLIGIVLIRLPKRIILVTAIMIALYPSMLILFRHLEWIEAAGNAPAMGISVDEKIELFKNGPFWQQCLFRIKQYQIIWQNPWVINFYFPPVFACYVFGIYLSKTNFLNSLSDQSRYWKIFIPALIYKIAITLINHLSITWMVEFKSTIVFQILMQWDQYVTSAILVILVILTINTTFGKRLWYPFRLLGQMSLTTYILESVLSSILFYSFGFGLYNELSPLAIQLYCLFFTIMIIAFNYFWLKRFERGPLETIWRKLSYPDKM